jgi:hypothetical protein
MAAFEQSHQLLERAEALFKSGIYPPTLQMLEQLNDIDGLRTQGMLEAEQHCRKFRMGAVPFSQRRQLARAAINYWSTMLRRKLGSRVKTRYLQCLANKAGVTFTLNIDLPTIRQELLKAQHFYRTRIKPNARSLRTSELEAKAASLAAHHNMEAATVYWNLVQREAQRDAVQAVRAANNRLGRRGVTSVKADLGTGNVELFDRSDIELACLEENKRRFLQASDTPDPRSASLEYLPRSPQFWMVPMYLLLLPTPMLKTTLKHSDALKTYPSSPPPFRSKTIPEVGLKQKNLRPQGVRVFISDISAHISRILDCPNLMSLSSTSR